MKSYKEIAQMMEAHIDKSMENPHQAIENGVIHNFMAWNSAMCYAIEEKAFTQKEQMDTYEKMLGYAEMLIEPSMTIMDGMQHTWAINAMATHRMLVKNFREMKEFVR